MPKAKPTINIQKHKLITITHAARILPELPSLGTQRRWQTKGVEGKVLETVQIGGRVYTTDQAFLDFSIPRGVSDD